MCIIVILNIVERFDIEDIYAWKDVLFECLHYSHYLFPIGNVFWMFTEHSNTHLEQKFNRKEIGKDGLNLLEFLFEMQFVEQFDLLTSL